MSKPYRQSVLTLALSAAFCAWADTGTTTTTTTTMNISMAHPCGKGGTRTTTGTFDRVTGALNLTVTLDHCATRRGVVQDGTDVIVGTFLMKDNQMWTVDLKDTVNVTSTGGANLVSSVRKCAITKKGSFNARTNVFDGEIRRDACTVTGTIHENLGLVEHILSRAARSEEEEENEEAQEHEQAPAHAHENERG